MLRLWFCPALILTLVLVSPIFIIRAQPYDDRAAHALIHESCPSPCFMRIRPGLTTLDAMLYILSSHQWSASRQEDFPAQVRYAVMFDAALPRTIMHWRWSTAAPGWIDPGRMGSIMVEDREILDISVYTYLSVGDIFLAFGLPDQSGFSVSHNRRFEYLAWYASRGLLISADGFCPTRDIYHLPAHISFRSTPRGFSELGSARPTCRQ
jgi:hypothetical protein